MGSLVRDVARSLCLRDEDDDDGVVRAQPKMVEALSRFKPHKKKTRDVYLKEGPITFSVNNDSITRKFVLTFVHY